MSVATLSPPQPARIRAWGKGLTANQLLLGSLIIAAALAALSLCFNHAIDYDPEGWIVYAREVFGPQALDTSGFPAWKPLPVLLIGPFTLLTRGEADVYYWLFITRACAVLTVFGVAALANRFGGRVAALLGAFFVVVSPYWMIDSAIGRDSAVSGAMMTGAFLAYYRGWYRWTVVALTGIALLRPEAAPLLVLYALWMWRSRRLAWWFPAGAIVIIAVLWLVPTILNTGLSPASISLNSGGANSAINTSVPFLTVIADAGKQAHQLPTVLLVIALIAAAYGLLSRRSDWLSKLWGRSGAELVMLGTGIVWVLIVAAETQKGYAGNPRYLVPAVVLFYVVGAVVAVRLAGSRRTLRLAVAVSCAAATAVLAAHSLRSGKQLIQQRDGQVSAMRQELAILKCPGRVITNHENNAYLAQISGEPLQSAINWNLPNVVFRGDQYWFVYCAPPS